MQKMTHDSFREVSGKLSGTPLETFFYILLRDHLTAGAVEEILLDMAEGDSKITNFSNGWVASHAKFIVKRLTENDS